MQTRLTLTTLLATFTVASQAQVPLPFSKCSIPVGVATDSSGNVFVHHDRTMDHGITKWSPAGKALGYVKLGGFTDTGNLSYLSRLPNGHILFVTQQGRMGMFAPTNGAITEMGNIRSVKADTSRIWDVATARYSNFQGSIQIANSTFGDISVYQRPDKTDVFVMGLSYAQTFHFVLRLRITAAGVAAKIVAASSMSAAGTWNGTRGVAVNRSGLVVATLPFKGFDRVVAFSADFPETGENMPFNPLGTQTVFSSGMATDSEGNFYIATGPMGATVAGANGSGCVVVLNPAATQFKRILSFRSALVNSNDVALSPSGDRAYVTVGNTSGVWYFQLK